jgi:hypothetical protein
LLEGELKVEGVFNFIRKNYGKVLGAILFVVVVPILLNFIIGGNVGIRVEKSNDWIGFFGSYSGSIFGGIIGALVAVQVARMQIEKQGQIHKEQIEEQGQIHKKQIEKQGQFHKEQIQKQDQHHNEQLILQRKQFQDQLDRDKYQYIVVNRSYVVLQEFTNAPFNLEGLDIHPNSRIILTEDYNKNRKLGEKVGLRTTFYKITLLGTPDNIFDCSIKIDLTNPVDNKKIIIDEMISIVEKNEEVFIPLYIKGLKEVIVNDVEINYLTVSGERIHYVYNPINQTEKYFSLIDGEQELLMEFNMRISNWLYPIKHKR